MTSLIDLGCFDQAAWMASTGHGLINTSLINTPFNWMEFHFQPILYVFALLYKISPNVGWFVLLQSMALSISVWPIYFLVEKLSSSEKIALIWSFAYL